MHRVTRQKPVLAHCERNVVILQITKLRAHLIPHMIATSAAELCTQITGVILAQDLNGIHGQQ
eukprot:2033197-Amphidinium_carterae.1